MTRGQPLRSPRLAATLVLGVVAGACGSGGGGEADGRFCKVSNEHAGLFCQAYERLSTRSIIVDGDDQEDYGDTAAYAPGLLFTLWTVGLADEEEVSLARTFLEAYERKIERFRARPLATLLDSDMAMEVYIGVLGALVAHEATREERWLTLADDYFDTMLPIVESLGTSIYYLPIPPYGPTTIEAGLAAALLHYPLAAAGAGRSAERTAQGVAILAGMDERVWNEGLGAYQYLAFPTHDYEYLYSNVTAVQALVRAWRLTGERAYLDRARTAAEGLESICSEEYGGYFASDESRRQAPHHGEEYIALSAQNYTIYADLVLYQATGDPKWLDRAERVFDFVSEVLWVGREDLAFHDIQHGSLADWYCTGCNWQLLYNLVLLDRAREGAEILPPAPGFAPHPLLRRPRQVPSAPPHIGPGGLRFTP